MRQRLLPTRRVLKETVVVRRHRLFHPHRTDRQAAAILTALDLDNPPSLLAHELSIAHVATLLPHHIEAVS